METLTRKEAATIMKKYEVNGMIGEHFKLKPKPKQEYYEAKKIWQQRVKEQKELDELMKQIDELN